MNALLRTPSSAPRQLFSAAGRRAHRDKHRPSSWPALVRRVIEDNPISSNIVSVGTRVGSSLTPCTGWANLCQQDSQQRR
ncbi:hypothetical protein KCP73_03190 [Salmonella enterica subsp. enterica]|nr:hypothetical protein KCP73_03190 [Salmonella enterica subsp. enterica]